MSARWSVEQVESVAPSAAAVTAARPLASPNRWTGLGADERTLWGSCQGSGSEPYDTAVDHAGLGWSCTCPSRRTPCKHALALLLLWVRGQVPDAVAPAGVAQWADRRAARSGAPTTPTAPVSADGSGGGAADTDGAAEDTATDGAEPGDGDEPGNTPEPEPPPPEPDRDRARDERVARMHAGLVELDRWLEDRLRTGLADPSLARYATWDTLAARLVDAQAGSLANRIRRLAGLVGASPDWHDDVLAELGMLHLLAQAGRRLETLPDGLADVVATTVGWQVRQADVLAGVPDTDRWVVAGRSDVREDRIEVRRAWLRGVDSGRWALVLSFAAYQQSLDTSLVVGTGVHADLHRYPGPALRALVGTRHGEPSGPARPPATTVASGGDEIGRLLVREPWLDRVPATVRAALVRRDGRWALTDDTGSLPVLDPGSSRDVDAGVAMLLAVSTGHPVDVTVEWTPHGVVPLSVHLDDRTVDIGPRAEASFVSSA